MNPNQNTSETLTVSGQPSAFPRHSSVAAALTKLNACPPAIRDTVLAHVARSYPDQLRSTKCSISAHNFDIAKADCILIRLRLETELLEQNQPTISSPSPASVPSVVKNSAPNIPKTEPIFEPQSVTTAHQADAKRPQPGPQAAPERPQPAPKADSSRPQSGPSAAQPTEKPVKIIFQSESGETREVTLEEFAALTNKVRKEKAEADRAADPTRDLDCIELEILRHLNHKSPLDNLPPDQLEELKQLVEEYSAETILNVITLPPPHGWGIQTSETSLKRFRARHRLLREHREDKELTKAIANPQAFNKLLKTNLNKRLAKLLTDPNSKTNEVRDLCQTTLRQTLAEARLQQTKQGPESRL